MTMAQGWTWLSPQWEHSASFPGELGVYMCVLHRALTVPAKLYPGYLSSTLRPRPVAHLIPRAGRDPGRSSQHLNLASPTVGTAGPTGLGGRP